ncbi:MAG: hypothetical protein ACI8YQ_004637 [Polaribacter sp.]|jgi:hypothetical protein
MPNKLRTIITVLMLLLSVGAFAKSGQYKVTANSKEIGTLVVKETKEDKVSQIEIISDVSVRVIFLVELNYKLNSIYENGVLQYSKVTTCLNDKVHSTTTVEKQGEKYLIVKDGKKSIFDKAIKYTGAMIYLYEVEEGSTVFSEIDAAENRVKKIGPNRYKLYNPKNKEIAEYYYENGNLQKAIVRQPFVDFIMTAI